MAKNKFNSILKNLATVGISILVSLLILEFGIRLFIPQDKKITWIEMHDRGFVMNQSGGKAFHEFNDIRADYRFSEQRTRGQESSDWDSNELNILTIGDSFTFGLLLQEQETYVSHLQNWADSTFSIPLKFHNAAVGGSSMADWPAWLETFGSDVTPDKVIYFMNNHDVFRALSKNLFVLTDSTELTLIESQRWKPRSFFIVLSQKNWYRYLQAHSDAMNLLVKVLWRYFYFEDVTGNFNSELSMVPIPTEHQLKIDSNYSLYLSQAILKRLDTWCFENGCDLIITNTGYFRTNSTDPHTERLHEHLKYSNEYEYIDLYPCVESTVNSNFSLIKIPNDGHPNADGAKLIFECLRNELSTFISGN